MTIIHYLAYGSNLHPHRLKVRIPSSRFLGVVDLPGYQLAFHKRGACGSGKCNLVMSPDDNAHAHGAIFEMHASERYILDEIEGAGYAITNLVVNLNNTAVNCFAYLAEQSHIEDNLQPFGWYREIVRRGAVYHGFPQGYIEAIEAVASVDDPDPLRHDLHQQLLRQFESHRP